MNALDRLLQDELNRLVDRIAARAGADGPATLTADLKTRIDRTEARLTGIRAALLEGYVEWVRAIGECEDLWAVAGLRREAEDPTERRRAA